MLCCSCVLERPGVRRLERTENKRARPRDWSRLDSTRPYPFHRLRVMPSSIQCDYEKKKKRRRRRNKSVRMKRALGVARPFAILPIDRLRISIGSRSKRERERASAANVSDRDTRPSLACSPSRSDDLASESELIPSSQTLY